MHGVTELIVALIIGLMALVAALCTGYFAYRARRASERLAMRRTMPADHVDPVDEFRRLADETRASVERAQETARSMRGAVERGVR